MNAVEFIKQYGWSKSSVIVFESIGHGANTFYDTHDELYYGQINDIRVSVVDIKQYVDAWELVEKHRGLKEAKKDIIDAKYLGMNDMIFGTSLTELKQAITLVEEVESLKEVS